VDEAVTIGFVGSAGPERADAAAAYEDAVLPLLADHGGELVFRGRRRADQDPALPLELQVIRFPNRAAYEGFLGDARRQVLLAAHGEVFDRTVVVELDSISGPA
jgi:uncharacterized protein (DUF1330 family)